MRALLAALAGALALAAVPGLAQPPAKVMYKLSFDPERHVTREVTNKDGKDVISVSVRFTLTQLGEASGAALKDYRILIKEEGRLVEEVAVPVPSVSDDLSVVLAMDVSGSMKDFGRIGQARAAANVFFTRLPPRADCGLILFDHEFKVIVPPTRDRALLHKHCQTTPPSGGTAYLDAAAHAVDMLRTVQSHGKAVVVMTDGVDLNSRHSLQQVIRQARNAGVHVFTVGIGEPGKNDPVTTVLALDRSGSMLEPADAKDKKLKIDALKAAAARFVKIMRTKARSSVLEFSDEVMAPGPFTGDKDGLIKVIGALKAEGETAFLDAAYSAVAALEAEQPPGKRAVVVLTDGIDNSSRRRKEEVIRRAKEAKVPLHMLGLGRPGELDEATMKEIAKATGGEYYHAVNEKALLQIFENLSIKLHDDGIDEESLKALASQTGGKYFAAKDIDRLEFILGEVSRTVQPKDYAITYPSPRQRADGTLRPITLELVRRGEVIESAAGSIQVRRVVVAEINYLVYLTLLGVLGLLLALPPMLRRLTRPTGGG
ncbi:MAG: VWA domain-containing protein [Gemmataceae bacterium]|nr:VWA domain-containing protein [Gemmataceae bacterium]